VNIEVLWHANPASEIVIINTRRERERERERERCPLH
jgi:hypothetical protein